MSNPSWLNRLKYRYEFHRYIQPLVNRQRKRPDADMLQNIHLFCQPRGGSTWLTELLLHIPHTALIDEPLKRGMVDFSGMMPDGSAGKFKEIRALDTYFYQPVPEEADWPEAEDMLRKLLRLELASHALFWDTPIAHLASSERFVFKFCFADLMLVWLVKHFNFRPIVMVRHPCAVVASQMRMEFWKLIRQDPQIDIPEFRYSEVFHQHRDYYGKLDSPVQVLAFIWALCVRSTIYQPQNNRDWCTLSYEGLYADFEAQIKRIFTWLQIPLPEAIYEHYRKPSQYTQDYAYKPISSGQQLSNWKNLLSGEQIHQVMEVLEYFEIDLYDEGLYPNEGRLYGEA